MTATQNRSDPPAPDASPTKPDASPTKPDASPTKPGASPTKPDASATKSGGDSRRQGVRGKVPRSRMGGVWVALIVAAFVLLFLLIFILQNGQRAEVSFLGTHGHLPMGVALLLAAVVGVLVVALPGTARIIQLRTLGRRGTDATSAAEPPAAEPRAPEGQ
jgi:uncharacterized integral membrane protein